MSCNSWHHSCNHLAHHVASAYQISLSMYASPYSEFKHKSCETTFLMFVGFLCISANNITRLEGLHWRIRNHRQTTRCLLLIYTAKRVILAGFENCPLLLLISLKIKSFTRKNKEAPIWSFNKQMMFYKVNKEFFIPS
jgi:hypothetical protein